MTNNRQNLGREGEARAARFLEARGYRIVARNVRADRVEIDLIARRGRLLVFVEVKSRRSSIHVAAAEAVDFRKQQRLRHGALAWLANNPTEDRRNGLLRFDVVTCILERGSTIQNEATAPGTARWSIEHWMSAF
jgi:putative endonuclease